MAARRCSTCGVSWPDKSIYSTCPECEGATSQLGDGTPLTDTEALSRRRHAEFERYCVKRDADREAQHLADLEAAAAATPEIPDPPGAAGLMPLPDPKPDAA